MNKILHCIMVKEKLKHELILPSLQQVEVNLVCKYFCLKYSIQSDVNLYLCVKACMLTHFVKMYLCV